MLASVIIASNSTSLQLCPINEQFVLKYSDVTFLRVSPNDPFELAFWVDQRHSEDNGTPRKIFLRPDNHWFEYKAKNFRIML